MTTAPLSGEPVELWIERPGYSGRVYLNCRFSRSYGWLDQSGRTIADYDAIKAWRPVSKGPYDGD